MPACGSVLPELVGPGRTARRRNRQRAAIETTWNRRRVVCRLHRSARNAWPDRARRPRGLRVLRSRRGAPVRDSPRRGSRGAAIGVPTLSAEDFERRKGHVDLSLAFLPHCRGHVADTRSSGHRPRAAPSPAAPGDGGTGRLRCVASTSTARPAVRHRRLRRLGARGYSHIRADRSFIRRVPRSGSSGDGADTRLAAG